MRHSLRRNIRGLILIPLFALGLMAFGAFALLSKREVQQRTASDVAAAKSTLETFLAEKTKHLELETKLLSSVPQFKNVAILHGSGNNDEIVRTVQNSVDQYSFGDPILIVGEDGKVIAASGPLKNAFPKGVGKLGWGISQEGKSWSGLVSLPQGLFLAATAPFMVGDPGEQYAKGAAICYAKMDDATVIALSRQLSIQIAFVSMGKVVAASAVMKPFHTGLPGSRVQTQIDGEDYVGLFSRLPEGGADLGFVTFRSANEIIGPSKIFLLAFMGTLAFGTFLAAGLAEAFSRSLVRPLEQIAQASEKVGQGKYPEPFDVKRQDEVGALQGAFNQMTAAVRDHENKLRAMIDIDPLTELVNHRRFKEELGDALETCAELSIVLFDLDHFSEFNRTKGMSSGDQVLIACGDLLRRESTGCLVSRYGGEEFAVLLRHGEGRDAQAFARGVLAEFAKLGFDITLSAGCADTGPGTNQVGSLCLAAELALTQAKQLGRSQVSDFHTISSGNADPYELNKFLQDGTIATIQALAAAVDAKDSYTKGHSVRVAEYAADLCRAIGGSDAEVELVYRTGTLHDVGKIGVPDAVLKKPGPLTAEERAIMETHPALGEIIVMKVPQLQDTLPGVRHHHERWDGKGYPDGLAGEDIPRLGRILAVADTFDAMTSDRPYRRGLALTIALEEIEKNAGVQFEPELAIAFVKMMRARMQFPEAA
jgi:diguanylate cyclase (GGDEF)-like protein